MPSLASKLTSRVRIRDWMDGHGGWVGGGGFRGRGGHVHVGAHHPRRHLDLEPPAPPTSCRRCRCGCGCAHYSPEADGRNGGWLGVGQISTCTKRTAPGQVPAPCLLLLPSLALLPSSSAERNKHQPTQTHAMTSDQFLQVQAGGGASTGYRLGQGARHARADVRTCVAL